MRGFMEQLFAFKKDLAVFRFYSTEEKDIVLKIEGTGDVTPQQIYTFLVKKCVVEHYIIKKNIVTAASIAAGKEKNVIVTVAESKKPVHEKFYKINFNQNSTQMSLLKKGAVIGKIMAAIRTENGEDPLGNPILPNTENPVEKMIFRNVFFDNEPFF